MVYIVKIPKNLKFRISVQREAAPLSGQDGPTATLEDGMGVLLGKEKWTVGNLGVEPRRYYSFRNIPYAHMVSEENRYKVDIVVVVVWQQASL